MQYLHQYYCQIGKARLMEICGKESMFLNVEDILFGITSFLITAIPLV